MNIPPGYRIAAIHSLYPHTDLYKSVATKDGGFKTIVGLK